MSKKKSKYLHSVNIKTKMATSLWIIYLVEQNMCLATTCVSISEQWTLQYIVLHVNLFRRVHSPGYLRVHYIFLPFARISTVLKIINNLTVFYKTVLIFVCCHNSLYPDDGHLIIAVETLVFNKTWIFWFLHFIGKWIVRTNINSCSVHSTGTIIKDVLPQPVWLQQN